MVVLLKKETHIGSDGCFFQGNGKTILRTNSQIIKISRGIVKWSQTINTTLLPPSISTDRNGAITRRVLNA